MNREIKFKAWDNEKKRMSMPFTLGQQPLIQWEDEPLTLMPTMFAETKSNRFIFLQFTGVKDKNGNDIYEGDWLRVCNGYISFVEYDTKQGSFLSIYKHPEDPEELLLSDLGDEVQVIGNVYWESKEDDQDWYLRGTQ